MTDLRQRILVVDDNKSLVMVMERILQKEGYDVSVAFDGSEAILKAQALKPDLVILDIGMPGIDGYEVCRQLQADPGTAGIPIVFLSSKGNIDERQGQAGRGLQEVKLAYSIGASDFLHKPVSSQQLLDKVRSILAFGKIISE